MVSYFVRYRGSSPDTADFLSYYRERHARVLKRFPTIKSLVLHTPVEFHDPFPVRPAGTMLLAQMTFESAADLDAALHSDGRRMARDDFANFPRFVGEVTHEALSAEVIF
jgi:uncharacterized protein (TIGR02118 family)